MTASGKIIEIQGTAEGAPFSLDELGKLVALAQKGIGELLRYQQNALSVA
ncbi:TPA: ribonuclease PH, partial [Neisseria gonorrhoeae]